MTEDVAAPRGPRRDRALHAVDRSPYIRAGGAWEGFRAALRRRGFRALGGESRERAAVAVVLRGTLKLEAEGVRALFHALDSSSGREGEKPSPDALRFSRTIARMIDPMPRRDPSAVLQQFESLMLEEIREAGEVRAGLSLGPEGLTAVLADSAGSPMPEADGATFEVRFANGPTLRENIRSSGVLFRAGAALLELNTIAGLALDFGALGRIELTPV
jgi:hypothetical protein